MSTDIGKIFEKQLEKVFNRLKGTHLLGWHKFADSASAGGAFVQEQPADYLLAPPPQGEEPAKMLFLEAKASEKHRRLQKAMLRPAQRGAIHFYGELLGQTYIVLFWDVEGRRLELWDGIVALSDRRDKQPMQVWESISVGTKLDIEKVAEALAMDMPPATVTLARYKELHP